MSSNKLENLFQLFTPYNREENSLDKFKCGKCKKILFEPYQVRCGCRYCLNCINEMMYNGCQSCPGTTCDCKNTLLPTFDFKARSQIMKLMKCLEEMCPGEFDVPELKQNASENRLDISISNAENIEVKIIFKKQMKEKLSREMENLEMKSHLKTSEERLNDQNAKLKAEHKKEKLSREMENHGMERHLKSLEARLINEIVKMKSEQEKEIQSIKMENLELKRHLKTSKARLNNEIVKMKSEHEKEKLSREMENLELKRHLKSLEERLNNEIAKLKAEHEKEKLSREMENLELERHLKSLEARLNNEIVKMKSEQEKEKLSREMENHGMERHLKTSEARLNNEIAKLKAEHEEKIQSIKSELTERFDNKIDEIKTTNLEIIKSIESNRKGMFEMVIYNVDRLLTEFFYEKWSEYFYAPMNTYKLRLRFSSTCRDQLWVYLYLHDDENNRYIPFPVKVEVTMNVINRNQREVNKCIKKQYTIAKPEINSSKMIDKFVYSISELTRPGISNDFIVQCSVRLKE